MHGGVMHWASPGRRVGLASVSPSRCLPGCGIFRILGYALTNVMTYIGRLFCLFRTALKYFSSPSPFLFSLLLVLLFQHIDSSHACHFSLV